MYLKKDYSRKTDDKSGIAERICQMIPATGYSTAAKCMNLFLS